MSALRLSALNATHGGSDDVVAPGLPDPLDSSTAANPAVRQYIEHSLAIAEQSRQKGNYRHAVSIFEQVLALIPNQKMCLLQLGKIWLSVKNYDKALPYLMRGVEVHSLDPEFHSTLGDCLYASEAYAEALQCYLNALATAKKAGQSPSALNKFKVLAGRAMYGAGQKDSAVQIYTSILKEDENEDDALVEYGKALVEVDKRTDALHVFLRVLVHKPDHVETRQQITHILRGEGGVEMLAQELAAVPASAAAAFGFLATVIKDYGAVQESTQLYLKALALKPQSSSYALNLIHGLEVLNQYQQAFDEVKAFCKANAQMTLVSDDVSTLSCADILRAIADVEDLLEHSGRLQEMQRHGGDKISKNQRKKQNKAKSNAGAEKNPEESADGDSNKEEAEKETPEKMSGGGPKRPYSAEELDLLAFFCTLAKIVFIVGALDLVQALVKLIEPVREGRELHTTTIRNELAYYCCIAQLMGYHKLPLKDNRPLYVAGDSHSMATAWHTLNIKGEERLLKPMLVTGLKMWHLRPESVFFPKNNFYNVVSTIPPHSDVVFLFGEIDCREGLIVSVEKCRYRDLKEGAQVTIQIFINVLKELRQKYKWNIYIHPVVPVLNETRNIVKQFNEVYKEHVMRTPGLHWLDFFGDLLTPDGTGFNTAYELDGTHMNPTYLPLLEKAMNATLGPQASAIRRLMCVGHSSSETQTDLCSR